MDLIDRKALIEKLQEVAFDANVHIENGELELPHGWGMGITTAEAIISAMPSAEHEQKMSRWGCTLIEGRIMCLNCGIRYDWDSQAQYYKYCPNCGSRMMEVSQDE